MRKDLVRYRLEGETAGLAEYRQVERLLHNRGQLPQSVWKLMGAGSVGSQALTGIPVVSRLRQLDLLAPVSQVWPFEVLVPELSEGSAAIVHAEIWPSLIHAPLRPGQVKDEAQVIALAEEFRRGDRNGSLATLFLAGARGSVEEGWILGVE
jgi:precorrin-8X/cobalt-precorrin-8 methylmutase